MVDRLQIEIFVNALLREERIKISVSFFAYIILHI